MLLKAGRSQPFSSCFYLPASSVHNNGFHYGFPYVYTVSSDHILPSSPPVPSLLLLSAFWSLHLPLFAFGSFVVDFTYQAG